MRNLPRGFGYCPSQSRVTVIELARGTIKVVALTVARQDCALTGKKCSQQRPGLRAIESVRHLGPGSCRTGLKEPSAAPGSPKRGTPRARRHTKRAGLGTPRAKRRRKRTKPGTPGSDAPPKKSRARLEKTLRLDLASHVPVEKSRVWYRESRGRAFLSTIDYRAQIHLLL